LSRKGFGKSAKVGRLGDGKALRLPAIAIPSKNKAIPIYSLVGVDWVRGSAASANDPILYDFSPIQPRFFICPLTQSQVF
jgi:hypothetical protein